MQEFIVAIWKADAPVGCSDAGETRAKGFTESGYARLLDDAH